MFYHLFFPSHSACQVFTMPGGNFERTSSASMKGKLYRENRGNNVRLSVQQVMTPQVVPPAHRLYPAHGLPITYTIYTTYTRWRRLPPAAFRYAWEHIRKIALGLAEHVALVVARADNAVCLFLSLFLTAKRTILTLEKKILIAENIISFDLTGYENAILQCSQCYGAFDLTPDY